MATVRQMTYVPNRCTYTYNVKDNTLTTKYDHGKETTELVTDELKRRLVRLGIAAPLVETLTRSDEG